MISHDSIADHDGDYAELSEEESRDDIESSEEERSLNNNSQDHSEQL